MQKPIGRPRHIRILAFIGALLLAGLYISTLVFALLKDGIYESLLAASIFATAAVPFSIYGFSLINRVFSQKRRDNDNG